MKVKLTKMRYIQGRGRLYAGEVIEWPHAKLGLHMVAVDKPEGPEATPPEGPEATPPEGPDEAPVPQRKPRKTQSDRKVL